MDARKQLLFACSLTVVVVLGGAALAYHGFGVEHKLVLFAAATVFAAVGAVAALALAVLTALAFSFALAVAVVAVAEREYKKGMVACATISVVLAFGMGVGFALVFGGVVGLAAAALLSAGYTLLGAAAFTGIYAAYWLFARDSSGSCG